MSDAFQIDDQAASKINIRSLISSPGFYMKYRDAINKTENNEYLHYKEIKYRNLIPLEFEKEPEKFWALIKFHRKIHSIKTKISDRQNSLFIWHNLSSHQKLLHEIDFTMKDYLDDPDYEKYQKKALMEEAIASAQISGSYISRVVAKQMLKEKLVAKTPAKKMIYNNFIMLQSIYEKHQHKKLNSEILFDLHNTLGATTKDESLAFSLNKNDHFLQKEIKKFIAFGNDELEADGFTHPIIKASILHFWLLFLNPFASGNDAIARAIFYWYLLRKGYKLFSILPISLAIKNTKDDYDRASLLSISDDNNLTYFIDYKIRKIQKTLNNFKHFIKQKNSESWRTNHFLKEYPSLNHRQLSILEDLHHISYKPITVTSHKNTYEITKVTAIKDLKGLETLKLIQGKKEGRNIFYRKL
jgi:Fic family protein